MTVATQEQSSRTSGRPAAHREELITVHDPQMGRLIRCTPSWDNRTCYIQVTSISEASGRQQDTIVFRGRVVIWLNRILAYRISLSFDGTRLAVAQRCLTTPDWEISINGEAAYRVENGRVDNFAWLSNDQLYWAELSHHDGDLIHTGGRRWLNGEDVTDKLEVRAFENERQHRVYIIKRGNMVNLLHDDATTDPPSAIPDGEDPWNAMYWYRSMPGDPMNAQAETTKDTQGFTGVHLRYRDQAGPVFDDVFTAPPIYTRDKSRVAYCGRRIPTYLTWLKAVHGRLLTYGDNLRRARGRLKFSWWLLLIMAPISPNFGPLYRLGKSVERFFMVDGTREWKKGYGQVFNFFYTPMNQLVAVVANGKKLRVVIDQAEGPAYDDIQNCRWIEAEHAIVYLARRGHEIYRVTVAL